MFVHTVLVAVCLTGSTVLLTSALEKPNYDLEDAEKLFQDFVKEHGKVYNRREYFERLEIFKQNLIDVNNRNEKFPQTVFKVNHMSDLKPEELQRYRGLVLSNVTKTKLVVPDVPADAADAFDWRDKNVVTHVKNQGQCGSCYIFSAIGNIEGQYALKHKQCVAFSEGQAIDCLHNHGCDGGIMDQVMNAYAATAKVMKEDDYPYKPYKGKCKNEDSKGVAKVLKGKVLDIADEEELKKTLVNIGPLAVGIDAEDLNNYSGGIMEPDLCSSNLDHGVVLVGYGEENGTPFWIVKNSWGTGWGESGYFRLHRGINACSMGTSYTATATVE